MAPVLTIKDSLDTKAAPSDVVKVCHIVACLLEKYGCESDKATEVAWAHVCWAARVAGVWPAIVDEAHGVRV